MGILTEACLREPAGLAFITMRQAVDLLSEARGVTTSDAAAYLIAILNDAVHEGRPGLFEQAGAARKVVADPGERYVQVIQSLDALRYGPPADDTNNLEMRYLNTMIKKYDRNSESRIERYRRLVAVLNRVSVRVTEFEKFAALSPKPAPIAATGEAAAVQAAPGLLKELTSEALRQKYRGRWASVDADLRRASENGLREAANIKRGWWCEDDALEWARARGKLVEPSVPPTLSHFHRLKG